MPLHKYPCIESHEIDHFGRTLLLLVYAKFVWSILWIQILNFLPKFIPFFRFLFSLL